ncbi:MAG TPA: UDP binding domain-containing protein, partial [Spirochaetota bacterium]|nr:UDP binding domain-containing protein [Spirochaetota bacterium]
MPEFILSRISAIMKDHNIKDIKRVGLYGLTYKENVDDTRESPTLQILEKLSENLAFGIKTFDPFINHIMVEGQELDFQKFLSEIDILVVLVAHNHIKENIDKIKGKIIFDTRNVINIDGVYKL